MDGILACNQAGCETLWVSTVPLKPDYISWLTLCVQYHLQCVDLEQEIGCARLVRRLVELEEANTHGDKEYDVIFPDLDMCLITLVS